VAGGHGAGVVDDGVQVVLGSRVLRVLEKAGRNHMTHKYACWPVEGLWLGATNNAVNNQRCTAKASKQASKQKIRAGIEVELREEKNNLGVVAADARLLRRKGAQPQALERERDIGRQLLPRRACTTADGSAVWDFEVCETRHCEPGGA